MLFELEWELARERSLNSQYNGCLDEALELCQQQRETIEQQHRLIVEQRKTIERYSRLIDTHVRPVAELFLQQRGEQ